MEQRTDQVIPPMTAAGTDPAFIPGLTPPAPPAEAGGAAAGPADVSEAADAVPAAVDGSAADPARSRTDENANASTDADGDGEAASARPEPDGGPVFEVSDRRSTIVADHVGITLRLDGEEAEFGWDEIGAVEIDTPRFGKRFSVTVYTSGRRWFQGDVEAPSRAALKTWQADLDAVLDARFDDGGSKGEDTSAHKSADTGDDDGGSAEAAAESAK